MASDAAFCAPVVDPACTVRVRPARDILFVMDTSSAAPSFRTVLVSYMQTAFCSFGLGAGSRVGVISFGSDVQVALPLTAMGPADFATRMAQVTTTLLANAEVTRPVAEAFDLALVELARAGANAERLVVFFAVGPPSPVPLVSGSATQAHVPKYGYPYAAAYYAYLLCVTADAGACVKTSIDAYLTLQVATSLTALRAVGGLSFAAVLVPPTPSVLSNGIGYYSGTPEYVSGPSCTFDASCLGACQWCKLYFNPISQQSECHCASLGAPLFLPSEVLNTGGQISGLNDTIVSVCETFELAPPTSQPAMASLSPTTALADASSGGLGTGAVVGIVLLALFIVACFVVVRARRRNAQLKDPDALRRKASMAAERRHSLATTQNFVFRNEEAGLSPTARDTDEARRLRDKGLGPLNRYHPTEQADKEWSQSVDHNTGAIFWANRITGEFTWSKPDSLAGPPSSARRHHEPNPVFQAETSLAAASRDEVAAATKRKKSFTIRYGAPKGAVPAAAAADAWEETVDPSSGAKYWRNTVTGAFSWHQQPAHAGGGRDADEDGDEDAALGQGAVRFGDDDPLGVEAAAASAGTLSSALSSALRPTLRSRMAKKKDAPPLSSSLSAHFAPYDEPDVE